MKLNYKVSSTTPTEHRLGLRRFQALCDRCYQAVLRRLASVRANIEREFSRKMAGYDRLLKAAITEAEALAWQTPYPHLFFPELAQEKAAAAHQWVTRQRALQQSHREVRPLQTAMVR